MYTDRNFKTKKALKEAVQAWNDYEASAPDFNAVGEPVRSISKLPEPVRYFQPGPFGGNEPRNGTFSVEGPHYPEPHRWYARVVAKDGVIIKVR